MQMTPEQETMVRALDIADLTKRYIALRDMKEKLEGDTKEQLARINQGLAKIEVLALAWLSLNKLDSAPNPFGTPYLTKKTGANMADRAAFNKFVLEDGAARIAFFSNSVSKDTVKAYMEANEGACPPGINWYSENAVNFKRA